MGLRVNDTGSPSFGTYVGELILRPLPGGREMQLFREFGFIDSVNKRWTVPADSIIDGASIPQALWSILGGPFEGKYRDASVIHDYYCDVRTRPWRDVHMMFYDGMRVSGVSETRAKVMYAAVYFQGPRWSDTVVHNANIKPIDDGIAYLVRHSDFQLRAFAAVSLDDLSARDALERGTVAYPQGDTTVLNLEILSEAISVDNPSLAQIEAAIDSSVEVLEPSWNRHSKSLVGFDRINI